MLEHLRKEVLEANLELVRQGLALYTFGNVSGIAREEGLVVIKPSGVPYEQMKPEHLVVTDLGGKIMEGTLRPSSDLPPHLVLYKHFAEIGRVAHTHSEYATAWAQARKPIPCFGTTHADYFHGPVPVTSEMSDLEIAEGYEKNTGLAIVQGVGQTNPSATPGVLVANHGPFAWGADAAAATHNAVLLEAIARMAYFTLGIQFGSAAGWQRVARQALLSKTWHQRILWAAQAQTDRQGKAMTLLPAHALPTRMVHLSPIDIVIAVFYFALVLAIGWYLKGRANTGEDFFMAGREMTAWVAGLSFLSANLERSN